MTNKFNLIREVNLEHFKEFIFAYMDAIPAFHIILEALIISKSIQKEEKYFKEVKEKSINEFIKIFLERHGTNLKCFEDALLEGINPEEGKELRKIFEESIYELADSGKSVPVVIDAKCKRIWGFDFVTLLDEFYGINDEYAKKEKEDYKKLNENHFI